MSWVTNLILHIPISDGKGNQGKIEEVNSFFDKLPGKGLVSLDDPSLPDIWYGGSKHLETNLYVGAFNHLDVGAFVLHLKRISWKEPNSVQLFVMDQEESEFRIIKITDEYSTIGLMERLDLSSGSNG